MTAVGPSQLLKQPDEKLAVPVSAGHTMQAPRLEVQRSRDPHFAVGPWSAQGSLLALSHPTKAHLGIGLKLGLVLEKRARLLLRHLQDVFESRLSLLDLLLGVFLRRNWTRPPVAEAEAVEPTANRLPANLCELLPEKLQAGELAAPAGAQPSMLHSRALFKEPLDAPLRRASEQSGLGPRALRSSKAASPSRKKRNAVS